MSKELQGFLIDVLSAVSPFKDVVTHVLMRDKEGEIKASARTKDGSLSIQAIPKKTMHGFEDKACFGALPYLHGALSSPYMEDGKIELSYGLASNNKDRILRSMKMKGKNRFSVFYQAIDPFVGRMTNFSVKANLNWPLAFGIDKDTIKSFGEVAKINALAPKAQTERDDIFQLAYTDGGIEGIFGENRYSTNVLLSGTVEAAPGTETLGAHFSLSRVRSILRFVPGDAIAYLSPTALRVDTETEHAEYQFTISAKKLKQAG